MPLEKLKNGGIVIKEKRTERFGSQKPEIMKEVNHDS